MKNGHDGNDDSLPRRAWRHEAAAKMPRYSGKGIDRENE
jgi:hypothetical protein